jgi:foldase protein PrsA
VRYLVALGAVVLVALTGCGGDEGVPKDAVAVVDGNEITREDYDALLARTRQGYENEQRAFPKSGTREFQTLKTQLLQSLVQREQLEQEAEELDVEVTDEQVSKRIAQIKEQYFGGDEKKYDQQLEDQGLTDAQVEKDVRAQLLTEQIFAKVTREVKVTQQQIRQFYDANQASYRQPDTREVRQIFVRTKREADALYAQLQAGADFAALARKHSQDTTTKDKGGKVTISRGQTVAAFDTKAFALKPNELAAPVKSEYGYHLIQALGAVRKGQVAPLKDLEKAIRQQLLQTKKNETMTAWIGDLEKKYEDKVDYQTGFAPPATATTPAVTTTR